MHEIDQTIQVDFVYPFYIVHGAMSFVDNSTRITNERLVYWTAWVWK